MRPGIQHTVIALSSTLLHSERPKLYTILAFLSATGLIAGRARWIDDVWFYGPFHSVLVISIQWKGDIERSYAMQPCLHLKRIPTAEGVISGHWLNKPSLNPLSTGPPEKNLKSLNRDRHCKTKDMCFEIISSPYVIMTYISHPEIGMSQFIYLN